jgi:hypothetical protein
MTLRRCSALNALRRAHPWAAGVQRTSGR